MTPLVLICLLVLLVCVLYSGNFSSRKNEEVEEGNEDIVNTETKKIEFIAAHCSEFHTTSRYRLFFLNENKEVKSLSFYESTFIEDELYGRDVYRAVAVFIDVPDGQFPYATFTTEVLKSGKRIGAKVEIHLNSFSQMTYFD